MRLSDAEHRILRSLAEATLPPGRILPGAGEETLQRLAAALGDLPSAIGWGYRSLLWALQAQSLARTGSAFPALPLGRRLALLEVLERREASRLLVRGLLTPLKLAYFDDPAVHRAVGCRFAIDPPPRERTRWTDQISDASELADATELECDAVVVGTGAGGAACGHALAERGHAVLFVEEGRHFNRGDFTGRPVDMIKKLYRRSGLTFAVGNTVIPIPLGQGVGGTTLVNSGTCFRAPETTLAHWREEHGLAQFTPELLAPFYAEVERALEVAPSSKRALGKAAERIAGGCDALGYAHGPLLRNAPGCDGQGLCCFGCPTDAKRSTNLSFVPAALRRGAQLVTGLRVDRVLTRGDRAIGVEGRAAGGRSVRVRAKVVVLACGSLLTPALLLRNRLANASGQLGRNLSIHPASAATAIFDEEIHAWSSVPQGYAIHEFHEEGILFEGAHTPLDVAAASLVTYGPAYVARMERYTHSLGFGFLIKDTSRGRVTVGSRGEPRIGYWLNARDVQRMRRAFGILARVFFAAGAKEVLPSVAGFDTLRDLADVERLERARLSPRQIDITAYHPLGTCRMGPDPLRSVVDPSHEVHDVLNLYICDGSVMPSSLGVNPQLTIMAMAIRAAGFIDRRITALSAAVN